MQGKSEACLLHLNIPAVDNLFLITDVERSEFEQEGKLIKIIPAYEWLIQ